MSLPFGRKLYGIQDVAKVFADHAGTMYNTFRANLMSKTTCKIAALLSGKGTGKSAFLDCYPALIAHYCSTSDRLRNLVHPASHPLILSVTLGSNTDYTANEAALLSGDDSIARRLVVAYNRASHHAQERSWGNICAMQSAGTNDIGSVLKLIIAHHRRVNNIEADKEIVILLNVDKLNQIHDKVHDEKVADHRVQQVIQVLRHLSLNGVQGTAVIVLVAGTIRDQYQKALVGSGIERFDSGLPLLNGVESLQAMKDCGVDDRYLTDPRFLQLLEDTGGVPRVLRMVLEGLSVEFDENCINNARDKALAYLEQGSAFLTAREVRVLIPFITLGFGMPLMSSPLHPGSKITFETLRRAGAIFPVKVGSDERLSMPMLLLETIGRSLPPPKYALIQRLIHYCRVRSWDGLEMFGALFHAYKMQYYAAYKVPFVTCGDFYGVSMAPEVASINIHIDSNANYDVSGSQMHSDTYRFPGKDKQKNEDCLVKLRSGQVILNGKGSPGGDCVMLNTCTTDLPTELVRSLHVTHNTDNTYLDKTKVGHDRDNAMTTFRNFAQLAGASVVTVHFSNRQLGGSVVRADYNSSVIICGDELVKFVGPTFQRSLLSATFSEDIRSAAPAQNAFDTSSH